MSRSTTLTFLLGALSVIYVGCGPDTGGRVGVSGTVTYQGQPLETGTIQFVSKDGSQMSGAAIHQGEYEIAASDGLLPGEMIVRVSSASESTAPPPAEEAPGDPSMFAPRVERIPAEFNAQSTLTTVIKDGGPNTYDIAIP
ncbi:hypothetical protein [Candidatus Laterigemmans baculatus]|uniref:hypothetical protein n=1 Tax=Candidatus Laterigemmans baculatus TaxID=2770505 RepID=UPI0013DA85B1|nr:hypothetical protein [Candidatus Laterigemmans baculatus]